MTPANVFRAYAMSYLRHFLPLARFLGGLPATKAHCPVLAEEAVKAAVADYLKNRKT